MFVGEIMEKDITTPSRASNKLKYVIGFTLILLLMGFTFFVLFSEFNFSNIMSCIKNADFGVLMLGFLMVIVYLSCYGIFTSLLLKSLGRRVGYFRGVLYAGVDFYFSSITPSASGGQPAVVYYMSKDDIPASDGTFSTILHTVIFKCVLIVLNLFALILNFNAVARAGTLFFVLWCIGLCFNLLLIAACLVSMFKKAFSRKIAGAIIRFLAKIRLCKNPKERYASICKTLDDYQNAAAYIRTHISLFFKLVSVVFVQRVAFFSIAFIVYRAMGLNEHGYFYFLSVQSLIALAVDSLPLPGGIGVNEAAIIMTLDSAFGSPERAAGGMLLIRVINYYFCLFICSIAAIIMQIRSSFKKRKVIK